MTEDEVLEALSADGCFTPTSLDLAVGEQGDAVLSDTLSVEDPAMDEAEARMMLMPAVRALPERERQVLYLRFFKQQTPVPDRRARSASPRCRSPGSSPGSSSSSAAELEDP